MAPAALRGGAATGRVRERDSSEPVRSAEGSVQNPGFPARNIPFRPLERAPEGFQQGLPRGVRCFSEGYEVPRP
ncbi:hypothetical protein JCM4914_46960 [Streptomyces platensis subsp. malvinus]